MKKTGRKNSVHAKLSVARQAELWFILLSLLLILNLRLGTALAAGDLPRSKVASVGSLPPTIVERGDGFRRWQIAGGRPLTTSRTG